MYGLWFYIRSKRTSEDTMSEAAAMAAPPIPVN
jgi:hypothetical protein